MLSEALTAMHDDAQVLKESAVRAAGVMPASPIVSPNKAPPAAGKDREEALAKELVDLKKRFLAAAKKKQADYAKRVCPLPLYIGQCDKQTQVSPNPLTRTSCVQVQELEDALHAAQAETSAQRAQVCVLTAHPAHL